MKKFVRILLSVFAAGILVPSSANAAILYCSGKIAGVAVSPNGTLTIEYVGIGNPSMCNIKGDMPTSAGVITPEICNAWLAKFTTALAADRDILMMIDYGGAAPQNCSNLANFSWQIPTVFPYFVQLK